MTRRKLTPDPAIEEWLTGMQRLTRLCTDVPSTPEAAGRWLRKHGPWTVSAYSYGREALAFAAWIHQHSTAEVLPVPVRLPGRSGEYDPRGWAVNRDSADWNTDCEIRPTEWDHYPRDSITDVTQAWLNRLPPTVRKEIDLQTESLPLAREIVERRAADLSWDDVLTISLIWWLQRYPAALFLPTPCETANGSPYHPCSWVLNADSPGLSTDSQPPTELGAPPHPSTTRRTGDEPHRMDTKTARDESPDPFTEFR